jgi:hypothetical protein
VLFSYQSRHDEQVKQFEEKKRGVKKKSEKELRAQSIILNAHHKKRQSEADRHFQNTLAKKCLERQEQLKAKLLNLHKERYDKKLAMIRVARGSNPCDISTSCVNSEAANLKLDHDDESGSTLCHHAVARHKRRKISTNNASFGMSIEVHNEGIIMQTKSSDTDHSNSSTHRTNNAFIPWGVKARKILHSVIYGEIPSCSEIDLTNLNSSGKQDLDGGMVRCMVSDS